MSKYIGIVIMSFVAVIASIIADFIVGLTAGEQIIFAGIAYLIGDKEK